MVVSLSIQLRGIVCDGKMDFEQLSKSRLAGVIPDFDGLGVICPAATHRTVICRSGAISRVTVANGNHSAQFFKYGFYTPEASAGKHCRLLLRLGGKSGIDDRIRKLTDRNSA